MWLLRLGSWGVVVLEYRSAGRSGRRRKVVHSSGNRVDCIW